MCSSKVGLFHHECELFGLAEHNTNLCVISDLDHTRSCHDSKYQTSTILHSRSVAAV
jgi:hypothetical protein